MTPFSTKVCTEGTRGNLRITVPVAVVNQLRETGFHPPGWVRLTLGGEQPPVFAIARCPLSRPSVTITLPRWWLMGDAFHAGDTVTARVEDAVPYRARATAPDDDRPDWLSYVDSARYLATERGDDLLLWSRHEEPFKLRRHPPAWALAALLASGPRAGRDFTMARAGDLAYIQNALEHIGIRPHEIVVRNGVLRALRSKPLVQLLHNLRDK